MARFKDRRETAAISGCYPKYNLLPIGDSATDEITYVGPPIEILTGYRVDQWTAAGWRRALHPEDTSHPFY